MKKHFSIYFLTFIITSVFGQKVDIDNFWIPISYSSLPDNAIDADKRTYNVNLTGISEFNGEDMKDKLKVYGWTLTDENPTLELNIRGNAFIKGSANSSNRTEQTKDKNGKVTSSTTYYKVSTTNTGKGDLYINGPKNSYAAFLDQEKKDMKAKEKEMKAKDKDKDKDKKEKAEKKETKEEKAQKEIAANPFLSGVNTTVTEVEEEKSPIVSNKELAYQLSLDYSYTYTTGESTSSSAASREYTANHNDKFQNHKDAYRNDLISFTNNYMNNLYGFKPIKENVKFKRMDSKDHPEFSMFDNATKALKLIFGKMRYNQSTQEIEKDLTPIISYFEGIAAKHKSSTEKHEKNLRAACYHNLCQIYYFLDNHDKVIEVGNKIIASDHEKGDGEDFIKRSEKIQKQLTFLNMPSRHITPLNDAESTEELGDAINEEGK